MAGLGVVTWAGVCDTVGDVDGWGKIVSEAFCVNGRSSDIDLGGGVARAGRNLRRNFLLRRVVRFDPSILTRY